MSKLDPRTIQDLNQAFRAAPGGFLVVDEGQPRFAVLDYQTYQSLKAVKKSMTNVKKVLITGGAGYIGGITTRLLQRQGVEVVVYDNLSTGIRERVQNCRLIVGDLADRETLDRVFREEQIDAVIHFAALIEVEESMRDPGKYYQNNVINGTNLLEAMAKHDVRRMVFSSSAAVYGESGSKFVSEDAVCAPTNPYGDTKLVFERNLQWAADAYHIDSVSLRYFNAAGAWPEEHLGYRLDGASSHLIPRVLDIAAGRVPEIKVFGQDYPSPDGTCIRDYVHVLDLAEAHALALKKLASEHGAFVYNVGTGTGHSVLEVIDAAVEVTGRMIPMKIVDRRPGDPARLVANSQKIEKEFNWQTKYDLRAILESSWQWHKQAS